jgi:hypothetical protein
VHPPRDPLDTKVSPRSLGPFVLSGHPSPNVYQIDFGVKFPNTLNHVNVDILRPYIQPSTSRGLRPDEPDLTAIGGTGPNTEIESLVGRQRSRGRPRTDGRPHYQYRVRFQVRDSHCDMWLTGRVLRQRYPTSGPRLIEAYEAAAIS